VSILLGNRDEE